VSECNTDGVAGRSGQVRLGLCGGFILMFAVLLLSVWHSSNALDLYM